MLAGKDRAGCAGGRQAARLVPGRASRLVVAVLAVTLAILPAATASALASGQVGGRVTDQDGHGVAGVTAELFTAQPNGGRDRYLTSVQTDPAGSYAFTVDDGCYVIVLAAPEGQELATGGRSRQRAVCVARGRADHAVDAELERAVSTVSGSVSTTGGLPSRRIVVDLFRTTGSGTRAGFVSSTATDEAGHFTLGVADAGCYQLVLTAPPGAAFAGGAEQQPAGFCVDAGEAITGMDAVVTPADQGHLAGQVAFEAGTGASGVAVELYAAAGDGGRGPLLGATDTGTGGRYGFEVTPGCYLLVIVAPAGESFVETGPIHEHELCISDDDATVEIGAQLAGSAPVETILTPVELEIVRLTNELRADPAGPLARQAPMPACVDDSFYAITIDPATGHPSTAPPLKVDDEVSLSMARAWAEELQRGGRFDHRPGSSQQDAYDRLGRPVTAWGENIAWQSGYPPETTARIHFEGWRESDTGHYCSLLAGRFTHLGVGEHRIGDESWAVQNFFEIG